MGSYRDYTGYLLYYGVELGYTVIAHGVFGLLGIENPEPQYD